MRQIPDLVLVSVLVMSAVAPARPVFERDEPKAKPILRLAPLVSPAGKLIPSQDSVGGRTGNSSSGSGKVLLTLEKLLAEFSSRPPLPSVRWLPNSRQLVLSVQEKGQPGAEAKTWIEIVDLDSGKRARLAEGESPQPSPDASKIAHIGGEKGNAQLWVMSVTGESLRPLTQVPGGLGAASFSWSPDSRKIAYGFVPKATTKKSEQTKSSSVVIIDEDQVQPESEIWITDLEIGSSREITRGAYDVRGLSWFPDGKALLCRLTAWFQGEDRDESFGEVRSISVETGEVRTLVKRRGSGTGSQGMHPVVSPDGKQIAFRYDPANIVSAAYWHIATVPAQGGPIRQLTNDIYVVGSVPVWSPDGSRIYFTCRDGVFSQVCVVTSDGQVRWLTRALRNASELAVSPDGRYLAWTAQDAQGRIEIRGAGSDGGEERVLLDLAPEVNTLALGEVQEIRWRSRDGLEIAGLLIKPVGYEAGKKYPLLVDVHGGPRGGVYLGGGVLVARSPLEWHLWATKGFVVCVPDYRSSGIYSPDHILKARERQDRNDRDFDDIMAGVDHVIKMGLVDETKLALIGHSYGAVLTNWIITHTNRFRVAVSKEGWAEQYVAYGSTFGGTRLYEWYYKGKPWEVPQNYRKSSAIEYVKGVKTPTLFVSGDTQAFPLFHNEFLYTALRKQGVDTQLLLYKGEGHVIQRPENQRDLLMRVLNWVDSHLR